MVSYSIPERNLETLKGRIEKLAKRADKLKLSGPSLIVGASRDVEIKPENGIPYIRTYYDVQISGVDVVKLNGWTLAAILDAQYSEDGTFAGNILRAVPNSPAIPEMYRTTKSFCDHCRANRRRLQTILVVNEAGEWKQVGSDCIKDFLGHVSAEAYAQLAQIILDAADFAEMAEDESDLPHGARAREKYAINDILSLAAASIRLYGWRSNKVAQEFGGQSTSGQVADWVSAKSQKEREAFKFPLDPNEADVILANDVCNWLALLSSRSGLNDYMYNLSLLGSLQIVTSRNFGLLCAAVLTYSKEQEYEINRRKKYAEDENSQYVGEIGKREVFTNLTLAFTTVFPSDFGATTFYKFRDETGNILVWFSSRTFYKGTSELVAGDVISLKATVKKQELRKGIKQTVITRGSAIK